MEKLSAKFGGGVRDQPKWIWGVAGFLIVLSLVSLAESSGVAFLVFFILLFLFGVAIWLMHAVDAFRNSSMRRGFFVLFLPGYLGRYCHKHCTNLFLRRLILAELLGTLLLFATAYMKNFEGTIFDDQSSDSAFAGLSVGFGGASSPNAAWSGFQRAAQKNDYSAFFAYLTPELQDMVIGMTLMEAAMKKVFSGPNAASDAEEARIKAVLKKHGLPTEPGPSMDDDLSRIPDKPRLFEDLMKARSDGGEKGQLDVGFPTGTLNDVVITGDTATGKVDGEKVAFRRIAGGWLMDLDGAMESSMRAGLEGGDLEWGATTSGRSSRRAQPRRTQRSHEELDDWERVEKGMTQEEVVNLLGKPAFYGDWSEGEMWDYPQTNSAGDPNGGVLRIYFDRESKVKAEAKMQ